jgi:hypothetical protein
MDDPAEALLRHILSQAAVLRVDGAPLHLLVPVPPALADALAVWGAATEDLEDSDDVAPPSMLRQLNNW